MRGFKKTRKVAVKIAKEFPMWEPVRLEEYGVISTPWACGHRKMVGIHPIEEVNQLVAKQMLENECDECKEQARKFFRDKKESRKDWK